MNASDRKNPRRLVRAIELGTRVQGAGFREEKKERALTPEPYALNTLFIGLTAPYPYLYRRIDQRVETMMRGGLLREVVRLVRRYGWTAPGLNGIGYRQFRPYFEGQGPLGDFVQRVKDDTHAYARRQMTWFKKEPHMVWFDVSRPGFDEKVVQLVKSFR
jgi:tRNA dimethylallyltransferase